MQSAGISSELDMALVSFEKILNDKDGDYIIDIIRKFKQHRVLDNYTLQELKHRLNK